MCDTTTTEYHKPNPAPEGTGEIKDAVNRILTEAFRLGCDCQSHAHEADTNPGNLAGVLIYVGEQMAALKSELLEMIATQSADLTQLTAMIQRVD